MIDGIRFKVCGLTSLVDAECADQTGADYLGFILYPKSPRYLTLAHYRAMSARLPAGRRRVAVMVEPSAEELTEALAADFDRFQLHFRTDAPELAARLEEWSRRVEPGRLWLAPKLPPGSDVPAAWLPHASTFLLDTFHPDSFGGSGQVGDWAKFARHRRAHPDHRWVLAGGLTPENVADAVQASGARWVDVNSGVEAAPGIKDRAKIEAFARALASGRAKRGLFEA